MCIHARWLKRGLAYSFAVYITQATPPTPACIIHLCCAAHSLWLKQSERYKNSFSCFCFGTVKQSWSQPDPFIHAGVKSRSGNCFLGSFPVSLNHYLQMWTMDQHQHYCDVLHMWNSPTFSREWLCTEEPAGCFGLRGPQTRRTDSSLHPCPHSSDGLKQDTGAQSQTGCVLIITSSSKHKTQLLLFSLFVLLLLIISPIFTHRPLPTSGVTWPQTKISWLPRLSSTLECAPLWLTG